MGGGSMDILHIIIEASYMVQFVMMILLVFSLTSWTIILLKYMYLRRAFKESNYFIEVFWESRDLSIAYKEAQELEGSPIARLFSIGYMELKKIGQNAAAVRAAQGEGSAMSDRFTGIDTVHRSLRRAVTTEVTRMTQMVPFLATAGNTAPFIGLFGTVWGIMESFHSIGLKGSASLAVVAPGISEALVATAAGLAVAIPSVIAFNYFMQRIRVMESELQSFISDFLNIIESDILPVKGKR
jgi:biopolymer transport protein TolQ